MELTAANLVPFWYTPERNGNAESDAPVKIKLKPLTQPQVLELFETFAVNDQGTLTATNKTWYRAGVMGIEGANEFENFTVDGSPIDWKNPTHRALFPYSFVTECGLKLCIDAWGDDVEVTEKN